MKGKKLVVLLGILAMVLLLAVPMASKATFAAENITEVSGNVTSSISISVPPLINLGDIPLGGEAESANYTITVHGESGYNVTVIVRDAKTSGATGNMEADTYNLSAPLEVKGGDKPGYVELPTAVNETITLEDCGLLSGGQYQITDFGVRQQVSWSDQVADGYHIILYLWTSYVG